MTVLKACHLSKTFRSSGLWRKHAGKRAVRDVSLQLRAGQTLAVVGESGSGKSTLARLIMQLVPADDGEVFLHGEALHTLRGRALRQKRRHIQMVFQDPFASLNPRMRIGDTVAEGLRIHQPQLSRQQRREKVAEVLQQCGIDAAMMNRYPHQFSGGQRQRIGIARALVVEPDVLVLDEPVSALDVSVQAQILNLLISLQQSLGLAYLFISHDLSVVRHISDEVLVMFAGQVVEQGPADAVFASPCHPYTANLLKAMPLLHPSQRQPVSDTGSSEEKIADSGCPFRYRCDRTKKDCLQATIPLQRIQQQYCRCLYPR